MVELSRFQQLRPVQKISEEEKRHVGLPLYPDDKLSGFANALRDAKTSAEYSRVVDRHMSRHAGGGLTSVRDINPVVRSLYEWIEFKAKPIRLSEFKTFAESLEPDAALRLEDEWRVYADHLIGAVARGVLHVNYCIDFQLLVRVLYLMRAALEPGPDNTYRVKGSVTAELVNRILTLPIVLPARVLNTRCREHCSNPRSATLPEVPHFADEHGRCKCECKCDERCHCPRNFCICIKTYMADLFVIKEELARYEEGDIAHIENILADEMKERRHRILNRTEETTESETESVTSEERDHQVSEKFTLQSEVKKVVDQKVHVDAGVTATLKYGDSVTLTPHANVAADFAKNKSESVARSYAKDIVDRAVSKVQEKVRKLQISKAISELEERNKHTINNTRQGADHRAGIYYWVNKVTHAQVYNYGLRTMFDAIVPEPAAMFKKLYELKLRSDRDAQAPTRPQLTPQEINRSNYGARLAKHGISTTEDIHPPDPTVCVQMAFSHSVAETGDGKTPAFSSHEFKSPQIPDGYRAKRMHYDLRCATGHPMSTGGRDEVAISVNVGATYLLVNGLNEHAAAQSGIPLPLANGNWPATGTKDMKGEEGIVTVAVAGFSSVALSLSGSISIVCEIKPEAFEQWQSKIFKLIMADYNRKLEAYEASENKDDQLFQIKGRNPFLNREIERNEFKRHIIAILMCNYFNGVGSMMEKVAPCGYPEPDFQKLAKDAPVIQFFEQVFEWNHMNYLFYHSMWARKCRWPDLIDEDSGDPIFDKFLMSGAARVQVPIRPGMEEVFKWFLDTKQIWGATGIPPVYGDDEYISMIQELKEAKQCDYSDRPGIVEVVSGSDQVKLTKSTFYWDLVSDKLDTPTLENDLDREILIDFKVYRIVDIVQTTPGDTSAWTITIDKPYPKASAQNLKHAVGARFVGAPWEIVIPTKLVYLRNPTDKLPAYPLT